jgi:hypothetical protein
MITRKIAGKITWEDLGDFNARLGNEFYRNLLGNEFYRNLLGNEFYRNLLGNEFYRKLLDNEFYRNQVRCGERPLF